MQHAGSAAGKDVTLLPLPGEGHGVVGEANLKARYEAMLAFLTRIHDSRP
jgi:dipeptidyl aminopeptidase/acylaminoacyl peptidase